jgi:hypothetical protein
MIVSEPLLDPVFDPQETLNIALRYGTYALAVGGVLAAGWWASRRQSEVSLPSPNP